MMPVDWNNLEDPEITVQRLRQEKADARGSHATTGGPFDPNIPIPTFNPAQANRENMKALAGAGLQAAAAGAQMLPVVGVGLATDAATSGLALPWQLAAGAAAMGAYDWSTGASPEQAGLDMALSAAGGLAGNKILGPLLTKRVAASERRGVAKAMGGAGEVVEAPQIRAGSNTLGVGELPLQVTAHPDRFKQAANYSGLGVEQAQAMNRDIQARGTAYLQGQTEGVPSLLDTHQAVTKVLRERGEAGEAAAKQFIGRYLKTEDPLVRNRLVTTAVQGNLTTSKEEAQAVLEGAKALGLYDLQVPTSKFYAEVRNVVDEIALPEAAGRLPTVGRSILNPRSPTLSAGKTVTQTRDLVRTATPLPEDLAKGRSKQIFTDSIDTINDILDGGQHTQSFKQLAFTDAEGVRHTGRVSQQVQLTPAAPDHLSMEQVVRLRSELLSLERKLPDDPGHVGLGISRMRNALDNQLEAYGKTLTGGEKAAFQKWRHGNALWSDFKDLEQDPFTQKVLEQVDSNEILAAVRNPADVERVRTLLTDRKGKLSPKFDEVKGTYLRNKLEGVARADGTYDAVKLNHNIFANDEERAIANRFFKHGELTSFLDSVEQHQTATDLRNALTDDSTKMLDRITAMEPHRVETLYRSLDSHPQVQEALSGALARDFIQAGHKGTMSSGDEVLASIAKARGLDPRTLRTMFPPGSRMDWEPALMRANEVAQTMSFSQMRLGQRLAMNTNQWVEYLKHRFSLEAAGAVATGLASGSMKTGAAAAGMLLSADLTWRVLKSRAAARMLNKAMLSPLLANAGGRAGAVAGARLTVGLLQTILDEGLAGPSEVGEIRQKLNEARLDAGITDDGVRIRLTPAEGALRVPSPTMDAISREQAIRKGGSQ